MTPSLLWTSGAELHGRDVTASVAAMRGRAGEWGLSAARLSGGG